MSLRGSLRRVLRPVLAGLWLRLQFRTTVIAVTGSVGKTTAKELLARILSESGPTRQTPHNENDEHGVPRTLLTVRPWHRYAVIEVGTAALGMMRRSARLVRPDIAIVLAVRRNHANVFRDLETTAREKADLLAALRPGGVAILNADDIRVASMKPPEGVRVIRFGAHPEADVRLLESGARWPERLRLTVQCGDEIVEVSTQLVGTHWASSVLAALAAAQACGIDLREAARCVASVRPMNARMQPLVLPVGAVAIRDENTSSPDTVEALFEVMKSARGNRRILVFGDVADIHRSPRKRLRAIGRRVATLAEGALFIGGHAHHARRAAVDAGLDPALCAVAPDVVTAAEWLRGQLRAGDLVFVKGRATDHLSRVVFAQFGPVGCRLNHCEIRRVCELCPRLHPGFDLDRALAGETARPGV